MSIRMLSPTLSGHALGTKRESRDAGTAWQIDVAIETLRVIRTINAMNFKHLYYFWHVAKAGGVGRAASSCT
jgi:hypothetical protein